MLPFLPLPLLKDWLNWLTAIANEEESQRSNLFLIDLSSVFSSVQLLKSNYIISSSFGWTKVSYFGGKASRAKWISSSLSTQTATAPSLSWISLIHWKKVFILSKPFLRLINSFLWECDIEKPKKNVSLGSSRLLYQISDKL